MTLTAAVSDDMETAVAFGESTAAVPSWSKRELQNLSIKHF
jgi:hypothetical protein